MRTAVVFGAGSVGRGFLGQVLCGAGWTVTFLDVDAELVRALRTDGCYPHLTLGEGAPVRSVVGPVTALDARDTAGVVEVLVAAELAATSVGARALPAVADSLAAALRVRIEEGRPPLNVLLAENLHHCAQVMRGLLADRLPDLPAHVLDANLGLLETSIGRMIPAPEPSPGEPTLVAAEPYRLLPYDAAAAIGGPLEVPDLFADLSTPFSFYGDRKLYVHNLGHCVTACLGALAGLPLVWQAIERPEIRYLVRAAMIESVVALTDLYQVPPGPLLDHVDDLLHRFGNQALADTTARVSRDLPRKLAPDDRLLGAYRLARGRGLAARHLSLAIAAAAVLLESRDGWSADEVTTLLQTGAGDLLDGAAGALLDSQRAALMGDPDLRAQISLIDHTFEPSRIV